MKNNYGFTLIELMVVVAIMTIVISSLFGVLTVARQAWSIGSMRVELQQEIRKAIDTITKELRQTGISTIIGVPADGNLYTSIIFQIPDDIDADGDIIDAGGSIEWGAPITYAMGGLANEQILRTSGGSTKVVSNKVSSLQFRRLVASPKIVEISLQAQDNTIEGRLVQVAMHSEGTLRN